MRTSIKTEIKLLLAENVEKALSRFKEIINPESNLFDQFILLLARHNDIKNEYVRSTVSLVERNLELAKIRGTLIKLINELEEQDIGSIKESEIIEIDEESQIEEWEDIGILEISDDAVKDIKEISSLFLRLTDYLNHLTNKTTTGADKVNRLKKSSNNPNKVILKKIVDEVGKEMINYAEKAKPEVTLFKQLVNSSIEKSTKLVEYLFRDNLINDVKELRELRNTMHLLKEDGGRLKVSMLYYRTTTEKLPNMTTLLAKGKREVIKNTDELIAEVNDYLSKLDKFIENIELTIFEIET